MKILVTGGAGFIGSHFVRILLNERPDVEVVVLDALTYAGNLANLAEVWQSSRFQFFPGKVQDSTVVEGIIKAEKVRQIVNFAAESHNDRSIMEAGSFIQTDVFGVYTLLEATRKFELDRMVHVSTDEVYGSTLGAAFTEASPIEPNTPYSASKAGGDLQCRAHHITYKSPVIVTRGGNNYGPAQYPEKLIPFFVTRLLQGKKVPVYGEGNQVREWIHVEDHCRGILKVLEAGEVGQIYNVGDTNEQPNREVVRILLEATDCDDSMVRKIEDPRKGAHDARYSMESNKTRALGWAPQKPFEASLRETVAWYANNRQWWEPTVASADYQQFVQAYYGKYLGEDL